MTVQPPQQQPRQQEVIDMSMSPGMKMMMISKMGDNGIRGFNGTGRSDERRDPWNMPGREPQHDPRRQYQPENIPGMTENRYYGAGRMEGGSGNRMGGYDTAYEPIEDRRRGGNGRFIRGEGGYDAEARMIGYDREEEDMPQMHYEGGGGKLYAKGSMMYQKPGHEAVHGAKGGEYRKVDEQMADSWVRRMKNADGSMGPHYKIEQAEQLRQMYCMECDKWEFYVALNMMYSDYCEVAQQMGLDKAEYYAYMAKAFLCDEDAGPNKLQKYFMKVVK